MRVRRGLLFWGLLLIPLGAIPLLARAGQIDPDRLANAWQLWPLIIIGAGILILASRTRLAIVGLIVMALTIGTIGGAALASGSFWLSAVGGCGFGNNTTSQLDKTGTFSAPAKVTLDLNCGTVDLRAGDEPGWSLHAGYRGEEPLIDAGEDQLTLRTPSGGDRRQDWTLGVSAASLVSLDMTANAATSTVDLGTAGLDELNADVNAGDFRLAAGSATIESIEISTNAGRTRLTLGSGVTSGDVSINAGALDLCVPPEAGLRLEVQDQLTFATNLASRNLSHDGDTWTRPAQGGAGTIELSVDGNAAAFNLDPNGGC